MVFCFLCVADVLVLNLDAFCACWDDFLEICGLTANDDKLKLAESDL